MFPGGEMSNKNVIRLFLGFFLVAFVITLTIFTIDPISNEQFGKISAVMGAIFIVFLVALCKMK